MTGSEMTVSGGLGIVLGIFGRAFGRGLIDRIRANGNGKDHGANGQTKEAMLRTVLREESRQVFEDALGQHVVPALNGHGEKLADIVSISQKISDGINKLVTIEESRRGRR